MKKIVCSLSLILAIGFFVSVQAATVTPSSTSVTTTKSNIKPVLLVDSLALSAKDQNTLRADIWLKNIGKSDVIPENFSLTLIPTPFGDALYFEFTEKPVIPSLAKAAFNHDFKFENPIDRNVSFTLTASVRGATIPAVSTRSVSRSTKQLMLKKSTPQK